MSSPSPTPNARVLVTEDGPYLVTGGVPLSRAVIGTDGEGGSDAWLTAEVLETPQNFALCRCGHSANKPFCDATHAKVGFDGTETAPRVPSRERARVYDGPTMQLSDVESLCAFARFCDPHGKVWNQVANTDDAQVRSMFIRQVGNCPSGRLVAWDKRTGDAVEPTLPLSIQLIEDPQQGCSGPLWLRGGIAVLSSDGFAYEIRNRVTLCRCGASQNKPFCDGSHASIHFSDAAP